LESKREDIMTVKKDKSSDEGREFWQVAAQASKTVEAWPAWKRGESTVETKAKSLAAKDPRPNKV
jgi:hypothetical protein